jgi:hypothetical protein
MYVLVSDNFVLNGPRPWSFRSFDRTLREDLNINYPLPSNKTDGEPIFINETVKILPATFEENPQYNPKIEYLHGPFWDLTGNVAIGSYIVEYNHIDSVKNTFKSIVTANRYNKEVSGITCTVQNTLVNVSTSRETRGNYVQRYLTMGDNDVIDWKFDTFWMSLTKNDMATIVRSIESHVQQQFDWEANKYIEIDLASTHQELATIALE